MLFRLTVLFRLFMLFGLTIIQVKYVIWVNYVIQVNYVIHVNYIIQVAKFLSRKSPVTMQETPQVVPLRSTMPPSCSDSIDSAIAIPCTDDTDTSSGKFCIPV